MITLLDLPVDTTLTNILQKYVKIIVNNKVWREGHLLLYKVSGFYIELILQSGSNRISLDIPYNLKLTELDTGVEFSYEVTELITPSMSKSREYADLTKETKHKLFNNKLYIEYT